MSLIYQDIISLGTSAITLDSLIGNLVAFELSNSDDIIPKIEASFDASLTLAPILTPQPWDFSTILSQI